MNRLRFPYGIADFALLRGNDALYIDRTDRIATVEDLGWQLLLLRPRRFGKSLWLSVLENYYDLARAEQFDALFGGLKIAEKPTPLRNRYFVMKWDLSQIDAEGEVDEIRARLYRHINGCIEEFIVRYQDRLRHRIEPHPTDALRSFQSVLAAVSATPHSLYLLIDEYDNFANEVLVSKDRGEERYKALVGGEGIIKTVFKVVKAAAQGRGLERVFITGVSPVVMADITSGYNVVEDISRKPALGDLCGFHETECFDVLQRIVAHCDLPTERADDALTLMRTFYNGYNFALEPTGGQIYNPTLALYFFKYFATECTYPEDMLDTNLAMDRNRIDYIARLPNGESVVTAALDGDAPITVERLEHRFGVEPMLRPSQTEEFLASLLYFFGVLTYGGRDPLGQFQLVIPNLVVRKLYVERIRESLLPGWEPERERRAAATRFYATGDIGPVCRFIEQRFLPVFDNRDLRWSNELVVKTAFLTVLFNDLGYIMDSETAIARGYCDLSMIVRPDARRYAYLDHVIEFKHLKLSDLPGIDSAALAELSDDALRARPEVERLRGQAEEQLAGYRKTLEGVHGAVLRLHTHPVVCIGLLRLIW